MTYFTISREETEKILAKLLTKIPGSLMIVLLRKMQAEWPSGRSRMKMSPSRAGVADLLSASHYMQTTIFDRIVKYDDRRWPSEGYVAPKATYKQVERISLLLRYAGDGYRGARLSTTEVREMERKKASRLISKLQKHLLGRPLSRLAREVSLYVDWMWWHGGWPAGYLGESPSNLTLRLTTPKELKRFRHAMRRQLERQGNLECSSVAFIDAATEHVKREMEKVPR